MWRWSHAKYTHWGIDNCTLLWAIIHSLSEECHTWVSTLHMPSFHDKNWQLKVNIFTFRAKHIGSFHSHSSTDTDQRPKWKNWVQHRHHQCRRGLRLEPEWIPLPSQWDVPVHLFHSCLPRSPCLSRYQDGWHSACHIFCSKQSHSCHKQ